MALVKFFKVLALPGVLEANAFYLVENGNFCESYLTDDAATAKSIGNSAMIAAVAGPLIAAQLAAMNRVEIVADIAARNALASADYNQLVLVLNATGDATVAAGAASYVFRNSDNSWIKVSEYEGMDVALTWAAITGKPASAVALIDDAVNKRHDHANKAALDKIGDNAGSMTYDGQPVGATNWTATDW
jgi:hypothetical protein